MSPVLVEAAYERQPSTGDPWGAGGVRWGFRATFGRTEARERLPDAPGRLEALSRRLPPPPEARLDRNRTRRGPREAATPWTDILTYGPAGNAVPLPPPGTAHAHLGSRLDRLG